MGVTSARTRADFEALYGRRSLSAWAAAIKAWVMTVLPHLRYEVFTGVDGAVTLAGTPQAGSDVLVFIDPRASGTAWLMTKDDQYVVLGKEITIPTAAPPAIVHVYYMA